MNVMRKFRELRLAHLERIGMFAKAKRLAATLRASGTAQRVRMERA